MAYSDLILGLSPVGYWRKNEVAPATNLVDLVGGYLAALGGSYTLGVSGLLAADVDKACQWSGGAAYAASHNRWLLGTGDFSVTLVAKYVSSSFSCVLTVRGNPTPILFLVTTSRFSAGDIGAETWGWTDATTRVRSPSPMNDGVPHHYAITYRHSNRELRLYIDGECVDTRVQLTGRPTTGNPVISFANNYGANQPFVGVEDEVAFFGYELTGAQISYLATVALLGPAITAVEDLRLHLSTIGTGLEALMLILATMPGDQIEALRTYFSTVALSREAVMLYLSSSLALRQHLRLILDSTDGTVIEALRILLSATNGTVFESLRMYLSTMKQPPAYKSIVAQRVSSVLSEVA